MSNLKTLKPWKTGQSGNPGGRPKKTEEMRSAEELARKHSPEAIQALIIAMRTAETDRDRIHAAEIILDRGWGKPAQTSNVNVSKKSILELSDDELISIIASERSERSDGVTATSPGSVEPESVH